MYGQVAGEDWATFTECFDDRQVESLAGRAGDDPGGMAVGVRQFAVGRILKPEEFATILGMRRNPSIEFVGPPAINAGKCEAGRAAFRPEALERIQGKAVVLAGVDGADHQVCRGML